MNDPIKNGYVNWVDGMKISKDHFIDMQRAVEDRIRDTRSIFAGPNDFGLIAGKANGRDSLDYNLIIEHPNDIVVEVYQCRATTPGGDRVEVVPSLNSHATALKKRFSMDMAKAGEGIPHDVIITVNSFNMSAYGDPDVNETPPRHPFTQPSYNLELVPSKEIKYNEHNRNYVIIARVVVENNTIVEIQEFIPPSMTMDGSSTLNEFFFKYYKFLKDLEQNLFKIVIKLNSTAQKTQLAANVDFLSRRMLSLLELEMDTCNMVYRHASPVLLVTHVMRFARNIQYSLELMTNVGKDELLNYIKEVIGVSPGEYMALNSDIIGNEYDHYDINGSLGRILEFCKVNGKLFNEFSRLDYIGKKRDTEIYVAEKPMNSDAEAPKSKRKWDF
jgi:hypothetical protein